MITIVILTVITTVRMFSIRLRSGKNRRNPTKITTLMLKINIVLSKDRLLLLGSTVTQCTSLKPSVKNSGTLTILCMMSFSPFPTLRSFPLFPWRRKLTLLSIHIREQASTLSMTSTSNSSWRPRMELHISFAR